MANSQATRPRQQWATAPKFQELAKIAKDVLQGPTAGPGFQFDQKVSATSRAHDGVVFSHALTRKAGSDSFDGTFMASKAARWWGSDLIVTTGGLFEWDSYMFDVLPGLKTIGSWSWLAGKQDYSCGAEYTSPYLHAKATSTIAKNPIMTVTAATSYMNVALGCDARFSVPDRTPTRWTAGAAYHDDMQQLGVFITDNGCTGRLLYGCKATDKVDAAAEIVKDLKDQTKVPVFSTGLHFRVNPTAVAKVKADSNGIISALYSDKLGAGGPLLTITLQLDTYSTKAAPKLGFAVQL